MIQCDNPQLTCSESAVKQASFSGVSCTTFNLAFQTVSLFSTHDWWSWKMISRKSWFSCSWLSDVVVVSTSQHPPACDPATDSKEIRTRNSPITRWIISGNEKTLARFSDLMQPKDLFVSLNRFRKDLTHFEKLPIASSIRKRRQLLLLPAVLPAISS